MGGRRRALRRALSCATPPAGATTLCVPKLVVITGPRKGDEFALTQARFVIGRDEACQRPLPPVHELEITAGQELTISLERD